MVIEKNRKLQVTLCTCNEGFQGDRFKKHKANQRKAGNLGHAKERRVLYCGACNAFGEQGADFPHSMCLYVRLSKSDMKEVVFGRPPLERGKALEVAQRREEEKKRKVSEKDVGTDLGKEVARTEEEEAARKALDEVAESCLAIQGMMLQEEAEKAKSAEEEEPEPLKKRVRLESSSDSDVSSLADFKRQRGDASVKVSLPHTSSPVEKAPSPACQVSPLKARQPCMPRKEAAPISQTFAKNTLVAVNSRLQKQLEGLQRDLALQKAKSGMQIKFEAEVKESRQKMKEMTEEREKERQEKARLEARTKELEKELEREKKEKESERKEREVEKEANRKEMEDVKMLVEKMDRCLRLEKEKVREKEKKLEALSKRNDGEKSRAVLHLECKDGRIGARHLEEEDGDASVLCYSDETQRTHCHHVWLTSADVSVRVKNVRWPSERRRPEDRA